MLKQFLYIIIMCTLLSCSAKEALTDFGEAIEMKHSTLLQMSKCEGYTYVSIKNPWNTESILHSYVLVPNGDSLPAALPEGDVIRIPLQKSMISVSSHAQLLDELGSLPQVKCVCDSKYMRVRTDGMTDAGGSEAPDIEKIIDASPDAILLSAFQDKNSYGRITRLGIPLIECADYMETSALGRAEWIKFFGILYGKEQLADSIFTATEANYNRLKDIVAHQKDKPRMFADQKTGSTWYVAGRQSTAAQLYIDAGADYIFSDVKGEGSVPIDPETVFDRAHSADIWLIKYNLPTEITYESLAREYQNYTRLKAFSTRNIYACNTSETPFFEETPFHPDLILAEYIKIFHPECLPEYTLRYFHKLK